MLNLLPYRPFDHHKVWKLIASAGTGKTFSIERTITELIEDGTRPEEIMYCVYNKAPAVSFLEKFKAKDYTSEQTRWWATHHAIMRRLTKVPPLKILQGPELLKWGKENGWYFTDEYSEVPKNGFDLTLTSLTKKIYEKCSDWNANEVKLLEALHKAETETQSFLHIRYLERGCVLGLFPPEVRYLFVDEAQDMSRLQMDWLSGIQGLKGLMLAGDDKQSINLYKGSDPKLFIDFQADETVLLEKTYRCPINILNRANDVIRPVRLRSDMATQSAVAVPGRIIPTPHLETMMGLIAKSLSDGESVLVLARNNVWLMYAKRIIRAHGLPCVSEWFKRHRDIRQALWNIHVTEKITEMDLAAILPSKHPLKGELRKTSYWKKGTAEKFRKGDFKEDEALMAGYEMLRFGDGVPLDECGNLGLEPDFASDMKAWDIPSGKWFMSDEEVGLYNVFESQLGAQFNAVRLSSIHAAKGEEADTVVLLTDITRSTQRTEQDNPDAERRVYYVAMTRAKKNLFITSTQYNQIRTNIV